MTQKGYPTGELLDVELYTALRALTEKATARSATQEEQAEPALAAPAEPESVPPEPAPARRGGRRCKAQGEA